MGWSFLIMENSFRPGYGFHDIDLQFQNYISSNSDLIQYNLELQFNDIIFRAKILGIHKQTKNKTHMRL